MSKKSDEILDELMNDKDKVFIKRVIIAAAIIEALILIPGVIYKIWTLN